MTDTIEHPETFETFLLAIFIERAKPPKDGA